MSILEDQVRAALDAHAEEFSAHPDAWARIQARSLAARRPRVRWRLRQPGRFLIPVAAAAVVVAIVLAVTATVHGVAGRSAGGQADATPSSPGPGASSSSGGPPSSVPAAFLTEYPPVSAVLTMPVTGPGGQRAVDYAWLAYTSQSWWPDQLQGLQACGDMVFKNGSSWSCVPLPQLGARRLAAITLSNYLGANAGPLVLQGLAVNGVASVTAVLPNGQDIRGLVETGRGFPDKAWAVVAPADEKTGKPAGGVRLVFRDASGAVVASLAAVAPSPAQLPEPGRGGIAVFANAEGPGSVSTMNAYLVKGYVGFWLRPWLGPNGYLAPQLAAGPPALAGLTQTYSGDRGAAFTSEAFGYAHEDVARVVLHLPGDRQVSTSTFAAWPGSGLRLWVIRLPADVYIPGQQMRTITATGYDTAGQVVARVTLGSGI